MKKLLLTLVLFAAASFAAQAQRSINWSTDSIVGLDTVYGANSGSPFQIHIVMKNNGTDTVLPGDSLAYQVAATFSNDQVIFAVPNNGLAARVINDTVLPGDTMHVSLGTLTVNVNVQPSSVCKFKVVTHVINRPNLNFETAGNLTNNNLVKNFVWFNPQGWPVGFAEELANAANSLSVYPNPSSSVVNFDIDYNKAAKVAVMDITGRLVENVNFEFNKAQVNVSNYNKGIYLYQVTDVKGHVIKSGKVTVN